MGGTEGKRKRLFVGLAKTMYTVYIYGFVGREITIYTVIYGVYIRFWPTLFICENIQATSSHVVPPVVTSWVALTANTNVYL